MNNRKGPIAAPRQIGLSASAKDAGAVDEDMFMESFEDKLPKVQITSARNLDEELNSIKNNLENTNLDWEKRIENLRRLRAIIKQRKDSEELVTFLRTMDGAFSTSLKDLRSKVVREACITLSYISTQFGTKCDRLIEYLLQHLINLIPNSAKIMSTSGVVTIRFLIQYTHSPRLLPIIASNLNSKSREIRKAVTEFLHHLLLSWPTNVLDKHNALLQNCIKKGMADADAEARSFSRKAFWAYAAHYKEQSEHLLHSLDPGKQKYLLGEQSGPNGLSNSLSTNSLPGTTSRSSSSSSIARTTTTTVNSSSSSSASRSTITNSVPRSTIGSTNRSGIPIISPKTSFGRGSPMRTTSAIDIGAMRAAASRWKAGYDVSSLSTKRRELNNVTSSNHNNNNGVSTPISNIGTNFTTTSNTDTRLSRSKSRYSQSTPNSRSTSPSAKISYITNLASKPLGNSAMSGSNNAINGTIRRRSGIPLLSREASPTRTNQDQQLARLSNNRLNRLADTNDQRQIPFNPNDFVDAFNSIMSIQRPGRRSSDDHLSDESETSSICSDMSFNSVNGRTVEDAGEIIRNLSSAHWSDRKEGLLGLQCFLRHSARQFTSDELKRITDIFTKMLVDPHTKTFSFFLEFLGDYLVAYKNELRGWLFILMTRLFLKLGTDLLGSVQTKIQRTLDIIQRSFSHQDQFNVIVRFLNDQTQTPTIKTKVVLLNYFHNLLNQMTADEWTLTGGNDLRVSLMKIIAWTGDRRNPELRKVAQEVLIDLFNLNTLEYLNVLKQLPSQYQDTACSLTQTRRRHSDVMAGQELSNGSSSLSYAVNNQNNVTSVISTPATTFSTQTRTNRSDDRHDTVDNSENLNPEQVFNSLKKTTDEIHKYISSMGNDNVLNNSLFADNRMQDKPNGDSSSIMNESKESFFDHMNGCESVEVKFKRVFDALKLNSGASDDFQKQAYNALVELINQESEQDWGVHFEDTLSLILDKISQESSGVIRAYSLKIMCELLYKRRQFFNDFIELTMVRILEASKDKEKEVQRAAELCAATAAAILPGDQSIRILKAVIATSNMPVNLAAIKMLTKVIEKQTQRTVSPLLNELMPTLIQAYDDVESAIRKAAVFCMVAIHNCVGEEINSYLSALNPSKMKLLQLYINRSKTTNSSGSSSPVSLSIRPPNPMS